MDDCDATTKAALSAVDNMSRATKRQCLTAVANAALCSCLVEKLPFKRQALARRQGLLTSQEARETSAL
jgi:hypothetical protein